MYYVHVNSYCKNKYFVAYFCSILTKILSASHFWLEANLIEVEVNVFKKKFPGFSIIDLSNKSIEEA